MLPVAALVGFLAVIVPVALTPGASFALVSGRGIRGDHRGAWATIAGIACGIMTHAVLAGVGLAAVVMRSAELYQAIRWAGALYLVGLGVVLLVRSRRPDSLSPRAAAPAPKRTFWASFGAAYFANVLNVKAGTVYLTLGPQFIPAAAMGVGTMLQLAAVHVAVMAAWLGVWAAGLKVAVARFDVTRFRRRIDAVGGAVLVALGIRTAATTR